MDRSEKITWEGEDMCVVVKNYFLYNDVIRRLLRTQWGKTTGDGEEAGAGDYGYTKNTPPIVSPDQVFLVNHYDDYEHLLNQETLFRNNLAYEYKEGYGEWYINSNCPECSAKGLLVGTRVKMLDGTGEIVTAMYYDDKGRIVQQKSNNQIGGYDKLYTQYDFTGNILQTMKEHTREGITVPTVERYTYTYDHANRLINTTHQLNQKDPVLLSSNTYDELGRLVKKERHNKQDTEEFEYNIRNWTTSIRSGDFEQKLYYNTQLPENTTASFNGNIAASSWTYNGTTNLYRYRYDALNRLTYAYLNGDTYFEEDFRYDKQGNITSLFRGTKWNGLDWLTMRYDGNQLKNVFDEYANSNQYGIKEYRKDHQYIQDPGEDRFFYDANGNLTADKDRGITTIRYNLLNLPDTVQFSSGNQIINHYAADGRKLCTRYFTLTNPVVVPMGEMRQWQFEDMVVDETATYYVDNFEYTLYKDPAATRADFISLTRINHAEGYVSRLPLPYYTSQPTYCYYRRDHLGNNREVWQAPVVWSNSTQAAMTIQRTQYYPSGLPFGSLEGDNPERQPYKYNGKEFITMHGYDVYDYGTRGYYPAIMRFTTVDPLAEKYYSVSPYAYVANNPILYIDPTGMSIHLNRLGYIVQENDDGDDGVYYHDDLSNWDSNSILESKGKGINHIGFIDESGGVIDINDIYTNLLDFNSEIAKSKWNPLWFRDIVKKGSDWDYKNNVNYIYGKLGDNDKLKFIFQGEIMEVQDIGNHHFGVVGKAFGFFTEGIMLRQAGKAQIADGTSRPEWQIYKEIVTISPTTGTSFTSRTMLPPYGDDPRDQKWIKAGFTYYKNSKK